MKRLRITVALMFFVAHFGEAQQQEITPETPVNTIILGQWLHSSDPRLIAWAADFARTRHDVDVLNDMPALLEHWMIPQPDNFDRGQVNQRRALLAVLDALIQEKVTVPISAIRTVVGTFPSQTAILISRLPLDTSRYTLDNWFNGAAPGFGGRVLARIAAMMLARDPAPYFVAKVVADSEEDLEVSVTAGGVGSGSGFGTAGDCLSSDNSHPGWPQIYTYYLTENRGNEYSSKVIDVDGDRIDFVRTEEGLRPCGGDQVESLNPVTRHRLIAHWLGVKDDAMSWRAIERASILWTNKAEYEQRLGALIESHRQKLHETVQSLRERRLLREDQPTTVTPKLVVTIKCDIIPCPLD